LSVDQASVMGAARPGRSEQDVRNDIAKARRLRAGISGRCSGTRRISFDKVLAFSFS
jgi:hypothetical protein